jgi:hypothetical protein
MRGAVAILTSFGSPRGGLVAIGIGRSLALGDGDYLWSRSSITVRGNWRGL